MPLDHTDLSRLAACVQSPQDALPCKLTDEWLDKISDELEAYRQQDPDDPDPNCSIAASLYLVPIEDLYEHFEHYAIEISLEVVRRRTDIEVEPASLETIFTDRDVPVSRKEDWQ